MSTIETQLAQMKQEILDSTARLAALQRVFKVVRENDCFTPDELRSIEADIALWQAEVEEKERYATDEAARLHTTINDCERKIRQRENVLNALFAEEGMQTHTDLMQYFSNEHGRLMQTMEQ